MNSETGPCRVLCCGTFDHFHPGHQSFLEQAARLGTELYVVVARDENVLRIKGRAPDNDEKSRRATVEGLGLADVVMLGNRGVNLLEVVEEISPNKIALGYDQRPPRGLIESFPGCEIVTLKSHRADIYKSSLVRQQRS